LNDYNGTLLSRHPVVNQPKDFTERSAYTFCSPVDDDLDPAAISVWHNNQNKLIEFMEICKADRLARDRKALLANRAEVVAVLVGKYAAANQSEIVPGPIDVCFHMEGLHDMILESDSSVEVNESSFAECLTRLPDFCCEWRRSKDEILAELVPSSAFPSAPEPSCDFSQLQLATTYFYCSQCKAPIHYPRILAHSCMTSARHKDILKNEQLHGLDSLHRVPWNFTNNMVAFHLDAFNSACRVLDTCDKDPAVTTAAELDELDARFECVNCQTFGPCRRSAMSWISAVFLLGLLRSSEMNFDF
jgi:hypothetical protein